MGSKAFNVLWLGASNGAGSAQADQLENWKSALRSLSTCRLTPWIP